MIELCSERERCKTDVMTPGTEGKAERGRVPVYMNSWMVLGLVKIGRRLMPGRE